MQSKRHPHQCLSLPLWGLFQKVATFFKMTRHASTDTIATFVVDILLGDSKMNI